MLPLADTRDADRRTQRAVRHWYRGGESSRAKASLVGSLDPIRIDSEQMLRDLQEQMKAAAVIYEDAVGYAREAAFLAGFAAERAVDIAV